MNFSLIFDRNGLHRSKRGSITAPIFFEFGELRFPGNAWSDFVVVILCWWFNSFSKIVNGWENKIDFQFMDGPMLIRILKIKNNKLEMECINQRDDIDIIEYTVIISQSDLIAELLKIANQVINACDDFGWDNDDTRLLKKEVDGFS